MRIQLVFNFDDLDEGLGKKCEETIRAIDEVKSPVARHGDRWYTIRITEYASAPINSDADWDKTLKRTLDSAIGRLRDFRDRLSQKNQRFRSLIAIISIRE